MGINDKTVLVTGGAQGIGAAIAMAYAREGFEVIIADIDAEAAKERQEIIAKQGHRSKYITIDVGCAESVAAMMNDLRQDNIILDVIINNAGISQWTPIEDSTIEDWDRVINTNLRGAYAVIKYGLPLLRSKAAIVNIASTRAFMSEPDTHAYSASKGGLLALTHSMAISLSARGIRVNAVSPGWIDVTSWQKSTKAHQSQLREIDHKQHPAGRVGKPEDVAEACIFLTSPQAGFITGTNIVVDGGMTVKMIYAE